MILPPQATSWGPGGPGGQPGPAVFPGENLPENICRMKNIYRGKGNAKQKGSSRIHFFSRRPNPARFPPALAVPGHLLDHFLRGLHQRLTFRFRNSTISRLLPILLGFRFRRVWSRKKVSTWFRKTWSRKRNKITRKKLDRANSANLLFES